MEKQDIAYGVKRNSKNMNEDKSLSFFERLQMIKLGQLPPEAVPKEKKSINKFSKKKLAEMEEKKKLKGDSELVKWYRARMKVMGQTCYWCGRKVENKIYSHAIFSICHILDKRDTRCPSVKTHPLNWITLCPDHHTMFDKMDWDEREELPFWDTIHERLIHVWGCLAVDERRFFPDNVRKWIEKNDALQLPSQ